MKLAEALLLRGDLQRALASLRERIGKNTLVQEDEHPSEDPNALLASAEAVIRRLQKVTFAINEDKPRGKDREGAAADVSVMVTNRFGLPEKVVTIRPKSLVTMLRNAW